MNAQELRIGNYISNGVLPIKAGYDQVRFAEIFEPIPLTEEWLLKFGFVFRGIYYHFPLNDIFKLEQYKHKNSFWLRHGKESIDCTRINYVHQLQNLYFALTGQELTIQE